MLELEFVFIPDRDSNAFIFLAEPEVIYVNIPTLWRNALNFYKEIKAELPAEFDEAKFFANFLYQTILHEIIHIGFDEVNRFSTNENFVNAARKSLISSTGDF